MRKVSCCFTGRYNSPRLAPDQSRTSGIFLVSICSSGREASAARVACCLRVRALELAFFIDFPFMARCLSSADDGSDLLIGLGIEFRWSMDHQHRQWPDPADRLPPFLVRVVVRA